VMGLDRTRFTHPDPAQIGRPFIGDLGSAPQGRPFTQEYTGTLGPSMRAVVPVFAGADDERVVALVSVGITLQRIQDTLADRLPAIALAAATVLAAGLLGAWLISRRLRRQTHGMGEGEITRMYEYYDAVLHAVREGLLLVDDDGCAEILGVSKRTLTALIPEPWMPAPITLGPRLRRWSVDELRASIAQMPRGPRAVQPEGLLRSRIERQKATGEPA